MIWGRVARGDGESSGRLRFRLPRLSREAGEDDGWEVRAVHCWWVCVWVEWCELNGLSRWQGLFRSGCVVLCRSNCPSRWM